MICLYPSFTPLEDKVCQEIGKLLVDRPLLCTSPRHHTAKWAVDVTGRKEIIVKMKKKNQESQPPYFINFLYCLVSTLHFRKFNY